MECAMQALNPLFSFFSVAANLKPNKKALVLCIHQTNFKTTFCPALVRAQQSQQTQESDIDISDAHVLRENKGNRYPGCDPGNPGFEVKWTYKCPIQETEPCIA
eukprot:gb/GECG01008949.1/.p1 GENE.gb/GECG01008949.1/~~gb/GECG01008949.1/.p1  ORF type:complete len:104 (+),score=4.69 gb/GECG01008949.1/:1-312(+)